LRGKPGIHLGQVSDPVIIEVTGDDLSGEGTVAGNIGPNVVKCAVSLAEHHRDGIRIEVGRDVIGLSVVIKVSREDG